MLLVPRWEENDDDDCIVRLVDALLLVLGPLDEAADVRDLVPQVCQLVSARLVSCPQHCIMKLLDGTATLMCVPQLGVQASLLRCHVWRRFLQC